MEYILLKKEFASKVPSIITRKKVISTYIIFFLLYAIKVDNLFFIQYKYESHILYKILLLTAFTYH